MNNEILSNPPDEAPQLAATKQVNVIAQGETAAAAAAAMATAQTQARYVMATQRPRNISNVRMTLLAACQRSGFAESAWYHKPIGKGVSGLSIRFAEEAVRAMGNISVETQVVFDDARQRIVRVSITDLESNSTYYQDVTVSKTVERRDPAGREVLGKRINSSGKTTYLVAADEDSLLNKERALISKAIRTEALRLIPGDIKEECQDAILRTRAAGTQQDPEAHRKRIEASFFSIGVEPSALEEYLGHPIAQVTPEELDELRGLYQAIKDGEASWPEALNWAKTRRGESESTAEAEGEREKRASEAADLAGEIDAAEDMKSLVALAARINKLPPSLQQELREIYADRRKELGAAGKKPEKGGDS